MENDGLLKIKEDNVVKDIHSDNDGTPTIDTNQNGNEDVQGMLEEMEDKAYTCYELFGIECGKGWEKLYAPILDYIAEYNKDKPEGEQIKVHQIKEKYGELRVYLNFYTDELLKMVDKAEDESYFTCENCGCKTDGPKERGGWIYALCDDCLENAFGN